MSLQELKDTAKEVDNNSGGFMEPKLEKQKGKRGRPKKEASEEKSKPGPGPAPEPEIQIPSSSIMKPIAGVLNNAAVRIAEDGRAKMTPDEENAFCEIGGKLLDKYAPNVFDKYGLEVVMVLTLSMWGQRVYQLRQHNLKELIKKKNEMNLKPNNSVEATPIPPEPKKAEAVFNDIAVEIPAAPVINEEKWDN